MRPDKRDSEALSVLGFVLDVDFDAQSTGITWKSAQTQPSQATIDAVDLSPAAVLSRLNAAQRAVAADLVDNDRTGLLKLMRGVIKQLTDELTIVYQAMPRPITSITRSGSVATATTMGAHGLGANGTVINNAAVFGADVAAYNGAKAITVASPTTFTYTVAGTPTTPATGSLFFAIAADVPPISRTLAQAVTAIKNTVNASTVD